MYRGRAEFVPGFSGMGCAWLKIAGAKLQNNHGFIWRFTTAMWDVSLLLVLTSLNLIPKYLFPALSAANDDKPECNSSLFGDLPPPSKASETAKGQKRKLKEDSKERKKSAPGENGLLNLSFELLGTRFYASVEASYRWSTAYVASRLWLLHTWIRSCTAAYLLPMAAC